MMWHTCDGSIGNTSHVRKIHVAKRMGCRLVYKYWMRFTLILVGHKKDLTYKATTLNCRNIVMNMISLLNSLPKISATVLARYKI